VIATRARIARSTIAAALDAADAPDLADQVHSRRLSVLDGADLGQSCLALRVEHVRDLTVFLVMLTRALPREAGDALADNAQESGITIYWPGVVLVDDDGQPELTEEQRTDAIVGARLDRQLVVQ
jgi:hypothetical protein